MCESGQAACAPWRNAAAQALAGAGPAPGPRAAFCARCLQKREASRLRCAPPCRSFRRRPDLTLQLFGSVQFVALLGDRLKQFTLVGMLGLLAPGSSFELLEAHALLAGSHSAVHAARRLADRPLEQARHHRDRVRRPRAARAVQSRSCTIARRHHLRVLRRRVRLVDLRPDVRARRARRCCPRSCPPSACSPSTRCSGRWASWERCSGFVGGGWIFDYFSWRNSSTRTRSSTRRRGAHAPRS